MITYEEAYLIAKGWLDEIDYCIEKDNAYIFCSKKGENCYGGMDAPCVVIKTDGGRMGMAQYVLTRGGGKTIHQWLLDRNGKISGELPYDDENGNEDEED